MALDGNSQPTESVRSLIAEQMSRLSGALTRPFNDDGFTYGHEYEDGQMLLLRFIGPKGSMPGAMMVGFVSVRERTEMAVSPGRSDASEALDCLQITTGCVLQSNSAVAE